MDRVHTNAQHGVLTATTMNSRVSYRRQRVLVGHRGFAPEQVSESVHGVAVGPDGAIHVVGDSRVVVLSPDDQRLRSWAAARPGYSLAVAADGSVYVGEEGQVELFDRAGKRHDVWRDAQRFGLVTAIGLFDEGVVVADVRDRCLRRCDRAGRVLNNIGKDNKMKGFLVPNRHLDFAIDREKVLHVCNPGKHRVERYTVDGKLLGHFGRFTGSDPAGFSGCCNPTNIALTPNEHVVVTEKAGPRAKLYDAQGKLLALIGEGDFDLSCKNMDVAVDGEGRVYVVDTVRLQLCVYTAVETGNTTKPTRPPASQEVSP